MVKRFSDSGSLTSASGISFVDAKLTPDSLGIYRASADSPDLSAVIASTIGSFDSVDNDMDGQSRAVDTQAGADHVSGDTVLRGLLTRDDVGPISYRPPVTELHVAQVAIANHDFDDAASIGHYSMRRSLKMLPKHFRAKRASS